MINLKKYEEKKKKKESEKRTVLLAEISDIDMELIESKIPKEERKISYKIKERRKEEEIEKFKNTSSKVNNEIKSLREKWKKEGFDPFR